MGSEIYIVPAGQKAHALLPAKRHHTLCGLFLPMAPKARTSTPPPAHRLCKRCKKLSEKGPSNE